MVMVMNMGVVKARCDWLLGEKVAVIHRALRAVLSYFHELNAHDLRCYAAYSSLSGNVSSWKHVRKLPVTWR